MSILMQEGPDRPALGSLLSRSLVLVYGAATYVFFLCTFLYAIGFVSGFVVPNTVDTGRNASTWSAILIDLALLSLFAVQHSGMARRGFKHLFATMASPAIERTTYVLCASLALALLLWQWRPVPGLIWAVEDPLLGAMLTGGGFLGWLIVLYSTFLISHFELFGLTQVVSHFVGRLVEPMKFRTPGLYRTIRHPIYLGFIIAFWSTPVMTIGHLLFAAVTTAYIMVGIQLEERDLLVQFGDQYRRYREKVAMLLPGIF